jgi:hypothetical protein
MMVFARRFFALMVVLSALAASAGSADAQQIKYYVVQSSGLFEITSQSTGGRFTISPRNEFIHVHEIGRLQVRGVTDRASRRETVATQIRGSGIAHVTVAFQPENGITSIIFSGPVQLPFVIPKNVRPNANFDNVTVTVRQNGNTVTRRLPIGTRP